MKAGGPRHGVSSVGARLPRRAGSLAPPLSPFPLHRYLAITAQARLSSTLSHLSYNPTMSTDAV